MKTNSLTTNIQPELFPLPAKPYLATQAYSGRKWKAVKNSSWGDQYKASFGDRAGYVVCCNNKHNELTALCTVIGQPFVSQLEIDANAKLIELAPDMAKLIEKIALIEEENYKDIKDLVKSARELSERFVL